MEKNVTKLNISNNSGEYKINAIRDSIIYIKESKLSHLLDLCYLLFWK